MFFNLSVTSAAVPGAALAGLPGFSAFAFAFWDVEPFGNSFVNGIYSGAPGRYLRSGSGTLNPYHLLVSPQLHKLKEAYFLGLVVL